MYNSYYEHEHYEWFCHVREPITDWVFSSDFSKEKFKGYPEWERHVFYLGQFITTFLNGGVEAYLRGGNGEDLLSCIKSAHAIGDQVFASSLEGVAKLFPNGIPPESYISRGQQMNEICEQHNVALFDELVNIQLDADILDKIKCYVDSKRSI